MPKGKKRVTQAAPSTHLASATAYTATKQKSKTKTPIELAREIGDERFISFFEECLKPSKAIADPPSETATEEELRNSRKIQLRDALKGKSEKKQFETLKKFAYQWDDYFFYNALAYFYLCGFGTKYDARRGVSLWRFIDYSGHKYAKKQLDYCLARKWGFATKEINQEDLAWYYQQANSGDPFYQYFVNIFHKHELLGTITKETLAAHLELCKKASKTYLPALLEMANYYRSVDPKKTFDLLTQAQEKGHPLSHGALGILYVDGIVGFLEKDERKAFQLIEKSAKLGSLGDQLLLYVLYKNSESFREFFSGGEEEAVAWLRKAADSGLTTAVDRLKEYEDKKELKDKIDEGIFPQNLQLALQSKDSIFLVFYYRFLEVDYEKLAQVREIFGMKQDPNFEEGIISQRVTDPNIVALLTSLQNSELSLEDKFKILENASHQYDDPYITNIVASCYLYGVGTEKSDKRAFLIWELRSQKGDKIAYKHLRYCIANKLGFLMTQQTEDPNQAKKDTQELIAWHKQQIAQDNWPVSLYMLAQLYENQLTINQLDEKTRATLNRESFTMTQAASDAGYSNAIRKLYYYYSQGIGGAPQDMEQAYQYCRQAVENGNIDAYGDLGLCYFWGVENKDGETILEIDLTEARQLLEKAAKAGSREHQFNLYSRSENLGITDNQAFLWLVRSYELSYKPALDEIATINSMAQAGFADSLEELNIIQQILSFSEEQRQKWLELSNDSTVTTATEGILSYEEAQRRETQAQLSQRIDDLSKQEQKQKADAAKRKEEETRKQAQKKAEEKAEEKARMAAKQEEKERTVSALIGHRFPPETQMGGGETPMTVEELALLMQLKQQASAAKAREKREAAEKAREKREAAAEEKRKADAAKAKEEREAARREKLRQKAKEEQERRAARELEAAQRRAQDFAEEEAKRKAQAAAAELAKQQGGDATEKESRTTQNAGGKKLKKQVSTPKEATAQPKPSKPKTRKEKLADKRKEAAAKKAQPLAEKQREAAEKLEKLTAQLEQLEAQKREKEKQEQLRREQEEKERLAVIAQEAAQREAHEKLLLRQQLQKAAHDKYGCKDEETSLQFKQSMDEIHANLSKHQVIPKLRTILPNLQFQLRGSYIYQYWHPLYKGTPPDLDVLIIADLSKLQDSQHTDLLGSLGLDPKQYDIIAWKGMNGNGPLKTLTIKPKEGVEETNSYVSSNTRPKIEVTICDTKSIDHNKKWVANPDKLRVTFDENGYELSSCTQTLGSEVDPEADITTLTENIRNCTITINPHAKNLEKKLLSYYQSRLVTIKDLEEFDKQYLEIHDLFKGFAHLVTDPQRREAVTKAPDKKTPPQDSAGTTPSPATLIPSALPVAKKEVRIQGNNQIEGRT